MFWRLTIAEHDALYEGKRERERKELELRAGLAAVIINHMPRFGKKKPKAVKVEEIIGYSAEEQAEIDKKARKARRENARRKRKIREEREKADS